jgi:hypothetical protein
MKLLHTACLQCEVCVWRGGQGVVSFQIGRAALDIILPLLIGSELGS